MWARFKTQLKACDTAIRRALCRKFGHKFRVGARGYYVGLPQAHCWRCGKVNEHDNRDGKLKEYIEPSGSWFD